ncbi:FRG domain-containing protein (plasmid) [Pseudorhodobacter turbinis]|uniref:FRG domain-containing protein n=1 Tax=Pseudorhodobacter turbinis TaxID=2500533 RepID=A0A4P8EKL6_9RHOB|nr:FRG domain-containing protein [Pseudorhodobacter turbinis]QCO57285.1 FRG domain-containing protein [Pseudorhodobacter turbinis]
MLKWSHYARFALAPYLYVDGSSGSIEETQAILQHYGWRSFYLDFSSNPAVSSWFASHQYQSDQSIEMSEDWHEDPIWRVHQTAGYTEFVGNCHLYAVDPSRAKSQSIHAHDLSSISISGARPRFHAQDAWLLGPVAGTLPEGIITHHFIADAKLFREYSGISSTNDLFPPPSQDPILRALMSVPWRRLCTKDEDEGLPAIPVFRRSLVLTPTQHGISIAQWPIDHEAKKFFLSREWRAMG